MINSKNIKICFKMRYSSNENLLFCLTLCTFQECSIFVWKMTCLWYITTRLVYLLTIVLPQRKHPFWLVRRILSIAESQVLFRTKQILGYFLYEKSQTSWNWLRNNFRFAVSTEFWAEETWVIWAFKTCKENACFR